MSEIAENAARTKTGAVCLAAFPAGRWKPARKEER